MLTENDFWADPMLRANVFSFLEPSHITQRKVLFRRLIRKVNGIRNTTLHPRFNAQTMFRFMQVLIRHAEEDRSKGIPEGYRCRLSNANKLSYICTNAVVQDLHGYSLRRSLQEFLWP